MSPPWPARRPPALPFAALPPLDTLLPGLRALRAGPLAACAELSRDAVRLLRPGGLAGAVEEAAWWAFHLGNYPWGLTRERHDPPDHYHLRDLSPAQRGLIVHDLEAARTPILLVHGIVDNRGVFTVLRRRLAAKGFGTIASAGYPPTTNDVRAAARRLAADVERLAEHTGHDRVHVVAHSLGGLVARYLVQRLGGDRLVHTLVTLGTPHAGTVHAHALPVRIGRQLRPGSELLTELALPAPGCATRFVAYWSDLDQVILPHVSARLEHPDLHGHSIRVSGAGHLALPRRRAVAHQIAAILAGTPVPGTVPCGPRTDGHAADPHGPHGSGRGDRPSARTHDQAPSSTPPGRDAVARIEPLGDPETLA